MSDEKMKELMRRMTAMSPESPEFPTEDIPTVRPKARRRSGVLVAVGSALLVIVLALPVLLWDLSPGSIASPSSPSTTIPPGPTTTAETTGYGSVGGVVFLTQEPENSLTGDPSLIAVHLSAEYGPGDFPEDPQIWQILTRPDLIEGGVPEGLGSEVTEGLEGAQGSAVQVDGRWTWTVDMDPQFLDGAGGLLADITMLNQLVYSITGRDEDYCVLFTVDDEPIEAYGSDGLDLTEPVCRDTFLDHVNRIMITEPVTELDGVITVKGVANVFEANVSYQVVAPGEMDRSGFTTATCGSGCWGDFEFTLSFHEVPEEGHIEIYEESAEDGSPTHVVVIPRSAILSLERAGG